MPSESQVGVPSVKMLHRCGLMHLN